MRASLAAMFVAFAAVPLLASPVLAAWPNGSTVNLPVCTASYSQITPQIVSDGSGGAIISWADTVSGPGYDIYAQHVLSSGSVDPAWPSRGLVVCSATNDQLAPRLVSDGAGGAIVVWEDKRGSATSDIYGQRVLGSGTVDPSWPSNGRALCTAANDQTGPQLSSDGAGGAIVSWIDDRVFGGDIYAQRILATGAVDPVWPANGRALCTATGRGGFQRMISDGAGGAIVAWMDGRTAPDDIYVQRVLTSGLVDPAWPLNGRGLCVMTGLQSLPVLVSDGAGGALVAWEDARGGTYDIYVGRVLSSGAVDPIWGANGRALCTATNSQFYPSVVSDDAGGAIVAWMDYRNLTYDIYAMRMLSDGQPDPGWPVNGVVLCGASGDQWIPQAVPDGDGGAIVTWYDYRGTPAIYAQHVKSFGVVDATWPVSGRGLATGPGDRIDPRIIDDPIGGAIVVWPDQRNGNSDLYAQRVGRHGYLGTPEPVILSVDDVPNDQGGHVKVSWRASYLDAEPYSLVTHYKLFRSVPLHLAATMRAAGSNVTPLEESGLLPMDRPGELLVTTVAGTIYYWEHLATVEVDYLQNYSYVATTTADSVTASNPLTVFMIQARTSGTEHWESLPVGGYSVDDLAPLTPASFSGEYLAGTTRLRWDANSEADLAGYLLHRGDAPEFTPGPGNLIATLPETEYVDPAGEPAFYKLAAVDVHGNVSSHATVLPSETVDAPGATTFGFALEGALPNPSRGGRVRVAFSLPTNGAFRLELLDVKGRRVIRQDVGSLGPGRHLVDIGAGGSVPPGVYLLRLTFGANTRTTRVAVLH